ncbi:hypothetical protein DLJ49_12575 [Rhodovulum sp. 12E13]|uniref:sulfotransferase domain-containing protein n=1 Tax=Rhodovulum sp. 12E13 TaxID=2203891 RepID=UPI000E1A73D6|nr:sulfotransferase domain-containing protein [Rhodovulum sp. 12E13]RDC71924.1 hypothetical protein DLJ49_12575 [Rhodovulum sp. 12E13]
MRPRLLICLGAQKSATTWVHSQLAKHPAVHMPPLKEVNYWNTVRAPFTMQYRYDARARLRQVKGPYGLRLGFRGLLSAEARHEAEIAASYAALLNGNGLDHDSYLRFLGLDRTRANVIADFTPWYALLSSETFAEIDRMPVDVSYLFLMRDPIDRLVSGVNHWARHYARAPDLRARVAERIWHDALSSDDNMHVRFSRYDLTIKRLEAVIPRERIMYLFYEQITKPASRDALAEFLDIQPDGPWEHTDRVNAQRQTKFLPGDDERERAYACLAPTYATIHGRFRDSVPEAWLPLPSSAQARSTP